MRDFVLEVVQRPAVLAGNSIGGYTALCAAVSLDAMCPALVLCNSAGRMLAKQEWADEKATLYAGKGLRMHMLAQGLGSKEAPPNWALDFFGRALIAALRPNVASVTKKVYPNFPDRADDRLVDNIVRDSKDPGGYRYTFLHTRARAHTRARNTSASDLTRVTRGYSVIAAGAKLPPPITKNELLHEFDKPLLVTQGLNDPLGGGIAKTRFSLYNDAHPCPEKVRLVGLEAGHCPHDEVADIVAAEVVRFISDFLPEHGTGGPQGAQASQTGGASASMSEASTP